MRQRATRSDKGKKHAGYTVTEAVREQRRRAGRAGARAYIRNLKARPRKTDAERDIARSEDWRRRREDTLARQAYERARKLIHSKKQPGAAARVGLFDPGKESLCSWLMRFNEAQRCPDPQRPPGEAA